MCVWTNSESDFSMPTVNWWTTEMPLKCKWTWWQIWIIQILPGQYECIKGTESIATFGEDINVNQFISHTAQWHKSCHAKCNTNKLERKRDSNTLKPLLSILVTLVTGHLLIWLNKLLEHYIYQSRTSLSRYGLPPNGQLSPVMK